MPTPLPSSASAALSLRHKIVAPDAVVTTIIVAAGVVVGLAVIFGNCDCIVPRNCFGNRIVLQQPPAKRDSLTVSCAVALPCSVSVWHIFVVLKPDARTYSSVKCGNRHLFFVGACKCIGQVARSNVVGLDYVIEVWLGDCAHLALFIKFGDLIFDCTAFEVGSRLVVRPGHPAQLSFRPGLSVSVNVLVELFAKLRLRPCVAISARHCVCAGYHAQLRLFPVVALSFKVVGTITFLARVRLGIAVRLGLVNSSRVRRAVLFVNTVLRAQHSILRCGDGHLDRVSFEHSLIYPHANDGDSNTLGAGLRHVD